MHITIIGYKFSFTQRSLLWICTPLQHISVERANLNNFNIIRYFFFLHAGIKSYVHSSCPQGCMCNNATGCMEGLIYTNLIMAKIQTWPNQLLMYLSCEKMLLPGSAHLVFVHGKNNGEKSSFLFDRSILMSNEQHSNEA